MTVATNGYTVELGDQTFTKDQWDAIQTYMDGRFGTDITIEQLHIKIAELEGVIDGLNASINQLVGFTLAQNEMLGTIKDNVEPALEAIAKSPIGKMFGMGK